MRCNNCDTDVTPLWRKGSNGSDVCNACGLYYKIHGVDRPKSMKKDEVRQRHRVRKNTISVSHQDSTYDEMLNEKNEKHVKKTMITAIEEENSQEKPRNKKKESKKQKGSKENFCVNLAEYKRQTRGSDSERTEIVGITPVVKEELHFEENFYTGHDYVSLFSSAVNCNYDDSFDCDFTNEIKFRKSREIKKALFNNEDLRNFMIPENEIECTKIEDEKTDELSEAERVAVAGLLALSKLIK